MQRRQEEQQRDTPGGMLGNVQQAHNRSQDIESELMNPGAAGPEGSLIGLHGSDEGSSNFTLKGSPLTDDLAKLQKKKDEEKVRPGILQRQNSMMQSSQPFEQSQLQQQLILQEQNLATPSADDLETRRLVMLLKRNTPNVDVPNVGLPVQVGYPVLPCADADMLMKQQQLQNNNQHQQQQLYSQYPFSSQHPPSSNQHLQQQEKTTSAGSITSGGSTSFQGNDQASENQMGLKRKQAVLSPRPPDISDIVNMIRRRTYTNDESDYLVEVIQSLEKKDIKTNGPVKGIDSDTIGKVAKHLISKSDDVEAARIGNRNKPGNALKSLLEAGKFRYSCEIEEAKAERIQRRDSVEDEDEDEDERQER